MDKGDVMAEAMARVIKAVERAAARVPVAAISQAAAGLVAAKVVGKRSSHRRQQQMCGADPSPAHNNKIIMKQTILALIRPKLNLSQNENQILHLIEHILLSPERQKGIGLDEKKFARDIFFSGGYISELYCAEYYVIRSSALNSIKKMILSNSNNLCLDRVGLQAMKKVLIQELGEEKTREIGISEQFEKAIYQQKSPALQQPWFNTKELVKFDTSKNNINKIFQKFSQPLILFELSFDQYKISEKIKINKNVLKKKVKTIFLSHPRQSTKTASIDIIIPMALNAIDFANFITYRALLSDYDFGILYKTMRKNGLIYDLSMNYNMYANAIQISFSCSKNKTEDALNFVKKLAKKNQIVSKNYLNLIKEKVATYYELDWGNISNNVLYFIEEAFLGEFYISPRERIEKIKKISVENINNFHKTVRNKLEKNSIITVLDYGKKVSKK